jgi:hypothetical protein
LDNPTSCYRDQIHLLHAHATLLDLLELHVTITTITTVVTEQEHISISEAISRSVMQQSTSGLALTTGVVVDEDDEDDEDDDDDDDVGVDVLLVLLAV